VVKGGVRLRSACGDFVTWRGYGFRIDVDTLRYDPFRKRFALPSEYGFAFDKVGVQRLDCRKDDIDDEANSHSRLGLLKLDLVAVQRRASGDKDTEPP